VLLLKVSSRCTTGHHSILRYFLSKSLLFKIISSKNAIFALENQSVCKNTLIDLMRPNFSLIFYLLQIPDQTFRWNKKNENINTYDR